MERWSGILKVPLYPNSKANYRVAVSLCLSPSSKTLTIPSANAIFFNGDRVEGTGNPIIERLSDLQKIAEILVSKFSVPINAWVIEASTFNGPFAVYKDFIPSVNSWGEPKSYRPAGFPASSSIITLMSNCLKEANTFLSGRQENPNHARELAPLINQPKTCILGFSKGGTVVNQLVTELGCSAAETSECLADVNRQKNKNAVNIKEENQAIPSSKEVFLNSITEIHYVDVGLNTPGAYLTNGAVIGRIAKHLQQRAAGIRFVLHGTPRQWCDSRRAWIRNEKDKLLQLLKLEAQTSGGRLHSCERFYFADKPPSLQMHFEIIEKLDLS